MASAVFKTVARPHERSRVGSTPMHSRQYWSNQLSAFSGQEPPASVLHAFGTADPPVRMPGGQGTSFRAGDIVLKPVSNEDEASWIAEVFNTLGGPGFRVPRPVASTSGRWVVDGWNAFEYIEAEHAGPNGGRWRETIAACRAFHHALQGVPKPSFIDIADHPWAIADRLAWGELQLEPLPMFAKPIARLRRLLRPVTAESQLIHGDFTANVLFAEGEEPCVIDFSPYWRPAAFAQAVVIADAISWTGASADIVDLCADVPDFGQYLARAVLRRVWELDQHTRCGRVVSAAHIKEYLSAVELVERMNGTNP